MEGKTKVTLLSNMKWGYVDGYIVGALGVVKAVVIVDNHFELHELGNLKHRH